MIICSCNVIRAADIRAAAGRGCRDAEAAYAAMGCEFECGGCRELAEEIVEQALTNPDTVDQQAA
ncbi:(2Fe-2S)-binding protein [Sphingomonas mesophila]|uniref:(2Fe-2S)-binding protein n=1 Tax=Sphingomonas mesophila TaxID=2303576 RepID=UPI000E58A46E|nr:(2Fe-2S)-binding protein [Sphingomonas mesophila]